MDGANMTETAKAEQSAERAKWAEQDRINELPFADLTVDQQIARIVNSVKNLDYWVSRVGQLENEIQKLKRHKHESQNGGVVVPIEDTIYSTSIGLSARLSGRHPLD